MPLSYDDFVSALVSQLAEEERWSCVAYAAERQLRAGERLQFPGVQIEVTADSYLGFVDQEPAANWGHAARYVIVNRENGQARSVAARLPPFGSAGDVRWRAVYRAPSVPDSLVRHE
jgi:hypothetical protein